MPVEVGAVHVGVQLKKAILRSFKSLELQIRTSLVDEAYRDVKAIQVAMYDVSNGPAQDNLLRLTELVMLQVNHC